MSETIETDPVEDEKLNVFCSDQDEDCPSIRNKVHCWLYAPENGLCPYLYGGVK